jgi:hypothetical protein
VAPVLVCPECSTKHPLSSIGEQAAFPCEGCGRTLKVPTAAMAAAASGSVPNAAPRTPAPEPPRRSAPAPASATRVLPLADAPPPVPAAVPSTAPDPAAPLARDPVPPAWVRFLLWIVAIPLAFIVVLAFARSAGMLTTNQISDVALAEGWGRFWPIARLIPFVALAAAAFVHGGAFLISRLRKQRWAEKAAGHPGTNGARPNSQSGRPRGQSTRTRA